MIDADLREVFLGDWEGGVMRIRAAAGDPIFAQMQEQQRWDVIQGASWDALNTRLMRGLHRIHTAHPDEKVVAVVHGGVIGHLVAHATGAQPFAFNSADNGSITHLVMLGDLIKVRSFNDSTHVQRTLHDERAVNLTCSLGRAASYPLLSSAWANTSSNLSKLAGG